jgi:hypothetical protein
MDHSESAPLVGVDTVAIDHVNVRGDSKSPGAQMWIAITPLLTVLIAAVSFVFTSGFQVYQTRQSALQEVDTEWRSSLEKVSVDNTSAAIGSFEMLSFLSDARYRPQARSIASAVLPSVGNRYEFDVAFERLLSDTDQKNQSDVITVAFNISSELRSLYSTASKQLKGDSRSNGLTLQTFVLDPTSYLDDDVNTKEVIAAADTASWELDTVSKGLSSLWLNGKGPAAPQAAALDHIIFMNADFSGVDFSGASMDDAYFVGSCRVENAAWPKGKPSPFHACPPSEP